jgi:hypothetical protein
VAQVVKYKALNLNHSTEKKNPYDSKHRNPKDSTKRLLELITNSVKSQDTKSTYKNQ